jgi:beta-lysine 5,6-aminomutase alpha subunit
MRAKLGLPEEKIAHARELAEGIVAPVQAYIRKHTTIAVERATLRLLGADGVSAEDVPVANLAADALRDHLGYGAARYYVNALLRKGFAPDALNRAIADGLDIATIELADFAQIEEKAATLVAAFDRRVSDQVAYRNAKLSEYRENAKSPMLYLIVATGNIHEDVKQATAAAEQGADAVAVIRTTAQSLLDYVPHGATTEGFGGTYATQENFRIMRAALDEASDKLRRYVRLVNYCSGLCMPEIAAMGAVEMINAAAEIIINTGEDNYLTTSDAYEKAYTVLSSQLINERFARRAGLRPGLIGLGHAFEIDPRLKNGLLYELAQAQMSREIFPECPLKYMPPTKFITGDIFQAYAMNTMFNFVSKATGQSIHLLGMLTEAIHTPFIQDRYLATAGAMYVMNTMADLADEIEFKPNGIIRNRAAEVLDQTIAFLEEVKRLGLFEAIAQGRFADVSRPKDGGKGLEGVVEKTAEYWNPVEAFLEKKLGNL